LVDWFKVRLITKGYNQEPGINFEETYSPVIRATTIRVILSIKQLDVSNAFLNENLTEMVFMEQPQGFIDSNYPDHVCLLHKSLYDLRQAPRAWFEKLIQFGFKSSCYDPSLFWCTMKVIFYCFLFT
jgi:Reverse transcriptase (RNA-dependent DNA polymerase)